MALKKKPLIKQTQQRKEELQQTIESNTTVTKGTSQSQEVICEGTPLDHHIKHSPTIDKTKRVVGVSVGSTINMGDYQSLRVDCWITDELLECETQSEGLQRLTDIATEHINRMVDELAN